MRKAFLLFSLLLMLQLKYSKRARGYAVKALMVIGFGATLTGFIVTSALFAIKMKMHSKHTQRVQMELHRQASMPIGRNEAAPAVEDQK